MKGNILRIAEKIYEISNPTKDLRRKWEEDGVDPHSKEWDLTNNVSMTLSDDHMMWYVWLHDHEQNSPYFKCVPRVGMYTKEEIAAILKAQHWVYI